MCGRKKGSGTLQKRGNVWLAIWKVDGKRFTRSTKTDDYDLALKRLAEFTKVNQFEDDIEKLEFIKAKIAAKHTSIEIAKRNESKVKIADMYDTWMSGLNAPTLSERTADDYGYKCLNFANWCKASKIETMDEVTRDDAEKFLTHILEENGDRVYNMYNWLMGRIWRDTMKSAHLETNPFAEFKNRKTKPPSRRAALTADELARLIQVVSAKDDQTKILFLLGLYTGLRLSDCCLLKKKNIDFRTATINIVPKKTARYGKEVHIPIHDHLKIALSSIDWSMKELNDYVLPDYADYYKSYVISRKVRKIFNEAQIDAKDDSGKITKGFHSLRVCFVTNMLNQGVPIAIVQSFTGHSTVKMAFHYVRDDISRQKAAIKKLDYSKDAVESSASIDFEISPDVKKLIAERCGFEDPNEWLRRKLLGLSQQAAHVIQEQKQIA